MKKVITILLVVFLISCSQTESDSDDSENIQLILRTKLQGNSVGGPITIWINSNFYKDGVLLEPQGISLSGTVFDEVVSKTYSLPKGNYTMTVSGNYGNTLVGDNSFSDSIHNITTSNDYYLYEAYYSGSSVSCLFVY